MKSATRLYSWNGLNKEVLEAIQIKSQADARKLGPFIDEARMPVTWVNWSKPKITTNKKTPPHFRHYPSGKRHKKRYLTIHEEMEEKVRISETPVHKRAKLLLAEYLRQQLKEEKAIEWHFKDNRVSDFHLSGNLLAEVVAIETEYKFKTHLEIEYQFDIALLGKPLQAHKEPTILGVIEIEKENKFGLLKCLICKSLGFPLISINIEELKLEDITEEWCQQAVYETTENSEDGLRRNYIYIHNFLYSVFTVIPFKVRGHTRHQYVIFCPDDKFEQLFRHLKGYKKLLGFADEKVVTLQKVRLNPIEPSSVVMLNNEGSIAGSDWEQYNATCYIRLTLDVPNEKKGNLYLFHLVIARLINSLYQVLVGYKYAMRLENEFKDEPIWIKRTTAGTYRVIPKQMSEPIKPLVDHLKEHGLLERVIKGK